MATKTVNRCTRPVTEHPATEELADIADQITQLQIRLDKFVDAHPASCRCTLCRTSDPDLKRNLNGLAISLRAFGVLINMDRPQSATETERYFEGIRKELLAAGSVENYLATH